MYLLYCRENIAMKDVCRTFSFSILPLRKETLSTALKPFVLFV